VSLNKANAYQLMLGVGLDSDGHKRLTGVSINKANAYQLKKDACPKCGSTKRERGEIYQKGSMWDVRFMPKTSFGLSPKKKMAALALQGNTVTERRLKPDME